MSRPVKQSDAVCLLPALPILWSCDLHSFLTELCVLERGVSSFPIKMCAGLSVDCSSSTSVSNMLRSLGASSVSD